KHQPEKYKRRSPDQSPQVIPCPACSVRPVINFLKRDRGSKFGIRGNDRGLFTLKIRRSANLRTAGNVQRITLPLKRTPNGSGKRDLLEISQKITAKFSVQRCGLRKDREVAANLAVGIERENLVEGSYAAVHTSIDRNVVGEGTDVSVNLPAYA